MMTIRITPDDRGDLTWAMGKKAKAAIVAALETQSDDDRMWTDMTDRYDEDESNRFGSGYDGRLIHESRGVYSI